ncbi:MAG: FAD-dependent thymidylate synthase [Chloroflexi bacterium]|nr:MAG: FAD-dependent thymidylate synthase [Chloroflexota bacterium]
MQIELVAYTQPNPALTPEAVADFSDLASLWRGKGTFAENVIEYAGRVCYRSTERMGTAPEFIAARVREGHEDIIEHIVVTVRITGSDAPLRWRMVNRHCEVSELGDGAWLVSGNTRVWLDFFRRGIALEALPILKEVTPAVFAEFQTMDGCRLPDPSPVAHHPSLAPVQDSPMRVTLLGYTQPVFDDPALLEHHGSAVFLFEGISRTCTHQLVRHRLGSFSQESQRYVDLTKGGWNAVTPPSVAASPQAVEKLAAFWTMAEEVYAEFRRLGIRKEDARFLLPNAAETRIVTTMNFAAWSHFFWLRAVDKAAQWEIRAMGQHALRMLYTVAPIVFQEHWNVYQERFANSDT